MKKFDIEKAKSGAAVCLKDQTPVKILDFNFNGDILFKVIKPGKESLHCVNQHGECWTPGRSRIEEFDLYMQPVCGYMAVCVNSDNDAFGTKMFSSLDQAIKHAKVEEISKYCKFLSYAKVELIDVTEDGIEL